MRPPELDGPEFPHILEHVWRWYGELAEVRRSGMSIERISHGEISEWAEMTGASPNPFEVSVLIALDRAFVKAQQDAQAKAKR